MKLYLNSLLLFICLHCFGQDTSRFTVRFPSGESALPKTQLRSLDSLIFFLDEALNKSIYYIEGHADSTGDKSYNLRLSEKRCRSLKTFLLKKGVAENRILFEKFGSDVPIATNETESGRADNRRTRLTIVTKFPAPDWHIKPQSFQVNSTGKTFITTLNGCKITVPEGAFELPQPFPLDAKIELQVTEYNNAAYFIASGIPMSYESEGKLFMYHSEEMLRIKAFYHSQPIQLNDSVQVTLNCRKVDSLSKTGFYKFNLDEKKWLEEETTKQTIEAGVEEKAVEKAVEKKSAEKEVEKITSGNKKVTLVESHTQDERPEVSTPTKPIALIDEPKGEPKKVPELKLDTGWIADVKIDSGGVRKKDPKEIDSLINVCSPNCCQAAHYIKVGKIISEKAIDLSGLDLSNNFLSVRRIDQKFLKSFLEQTEDRIGSKNYYHVKLKAKKLFLRRKALITLKYDKDKNPELKALAKVSWVYRFKDNSEPYASFKNRAFHDIRVTYDPATNTTTLKLEEKDKSPELTVTPGTRKNRCPKK